jgi:CheY-like chemotaxis protein
LIFSRRDPARRQTIDLNDVIVDLEKLLQRALGEHVELATRLAKDLWAIEADIGQIEQVITNLAVNARDAMPRGGRLTVESANVLVDDRYLVEHPGTKLGRYVRLVVTDTGTGMSDDVTERAFEPFFTTKAKGEGTGLGLSTVYGIVFDAGGSIGLYSTPGVGTAVHVLLPVVDRKVETAASARVTRQRARGERVLLVEDETSVRRVARRILDKGGYHVVEASNGRDALELLDQAAAGFDLLLTDVIMPGMLGKELADTAVGRHPDLPVLFMSGYNDQILARDEDDGASPPFIEKPFNSETLLASVREVLDAGPA